MNLVSTIIDLIKEDAKLRGIRESITIGEYLEHYKHEMDIELLEAVLFMIDGHSNHEDIKEEQRVGIQYIENVVSKQYKEALRDRLTKLDIFEHDNYDLSAKRFILGHHLILENGLQTMIHESAKSRLRKIIKNLEKIFGGKFTPEQLSELNSIVPRLAKEGKISKDSEKDYSKICNRRKILVTSNTTLSYHADDRSIEREIDPRDDVINYVNTALFMFDQGYREDHKHHRYVYVSADGSTAIGVDIEKDEAKTIISFWQYPYRNEFNTIVKEVVKCAENMMNQSSEN